MNNRVLAALTFVAMLIAASALLSSRASGSLSSTADERLSGKLRIDGSSTVLPIMQAAAELFHSVQPKVRVTVGVSGTGGGFKKFLADQPELRTDVNDASRPITEEEQARAKKLGVDYIEVPLGLDGIAVVVNPENDFCDNLTVDELRRIWAPDSKITSWSQVRDGMPDVPLKLFGPGTDSGTYDYFTETIVGDSGACRSDFTASESDNVLVQGVAGEKGALGYFGFAYYEANQQRLKLLGVDPGTGAPIQPSHETIATRAYRPLSRPLFVYVNAESAKRAEVKAFFTFLFANAERIVEHPRVQYIALEPALYKLAAARLDGGVTGSELAKPGAANKSLAELFALDKRE